MKNKLVLILFFLLIFSINVQAGIINYSFEVQNSDYNTDALGWTEFKTNALFQDYNAETQVCSNQSVTPSILADTFIREFSEDARNGNYIFKTFSSEVGVSFTRNNYYIGELGIDTNICFWIKGWVSGGTGFRLGFWDNMTNNYCRVADIGSVDENWNYACGTFKTGSYNGFLTLEKEWRTTGIELLWDGFDSSSLGINILKPTPNQYIKQRDLLTVEFEIQDNDFNFLNLNPEGIQYRLDLLDDWNSIEASEFGINSFNTTAPDETGEHILTIRALVNGAWIHGSTKYLVSPQKIDLKINFIKAIQVIEDVNLVSGKATAVKVGVNNTNNAEEDQNVTVELTFNGQEYPLTEEFYGDYNFIFYVNNPFEIEDATVVFYLTAKIDPQNNYEENDENNNSLVQEVIVKRTSDLNVLFIAFDYGQDLDSFEKIVAQSIEFLEATYPIMNYDYYLVNYTGNLNLDQNYNKILFRLMKEIKLIGEDVNKNKFKAFRFVGVVPNGWHVDHNEFESKGATPCKKDTIPLECKPYFLIEDGNRSVLAHEIGHTYGLNEEYELKLNEPNPSPTDCGITFCSNYQQKYIDKNWCLGSVVTNGIWVNEKKVFVNQDLNICNYSNPYSYMGTALYSPPDRWTTFNEYDYLSEKLYLGGQFGKSNNQDLNILFVKGFVDKNLNVELDHLYKIDRTEEFGSSDGNCLIRTLDSNVSIINDYNFSVNFDLFSEGINTIDYSPFVLGINFNENLNSVQVICNGELKTERSISQNAPTVSISFPKTGDIWTDTNTLSWTSDDLDGDELSFALYYSADNGSIWIPIQSDVNDLSYSFPSWIVEGTNQFKFKVIASDGILSSESISDTFTVANADINVTPNEKNFGTINNLQNVSQDFNIVNSGNADLNVFDENHSGNLSLTGLSLPIVLQPGENHVFSVELNVLGMSLGEFTEDIALGSNDPNQIVKRIKVYGVIEQAKPDFTIKADNITFNPVYPEQDENVQISALIENVGDLNAENVNVEFYMKSANQYLSDSNTVALYHFNEGTGATVKDKSENNNDGDINNATFNGDGKFDNYSLRFNGNGSKNVVIVPDSDSLDISGELTFEAWIKPDGTQEGGAGIICKGYGSNEIFCLDIASSKFRFIVRAPSLFLLTSNSTVDIGKWQHVAAVYDGTTMKIYINNQLDNSMAGPSSLQTNNHELSIGAREGSDTSDYDLEFKGLIDEVRISNIARSDFNKNKIFIDDKNISFIDANSSELVSVDWNNVKAEDYEIYVKVDDENLFDERNELNNEDYNSVIVYSEPILSTEFEYSTLNDLGELFDFNAIITNKGAKLRDANATLILPEELTTTDSIIKTIGDLNSNTLIKLEWTDINSSQAGVYEIKVNVKGTNVDENFSTLVSIKHIELSDLNTITTIYSDDTNIAYFNIINYNLNNSYAGYYYRTEISGPQNYSYDKNVGLLYAGETKQLTAQIPDWKETRNYSLTVSLYDYYDTLVDQKQDSFEVVSYLPSFLTYYSTDGLTFNSELSENADYFTSATDKNDGVMVVYSYKGSLDYALRDSILQEWNIGISNLGNGNYPYLSVDGNEFYLVYVDGNIYYTNHFPPGSWSSRQLVSTLNTVDPVITKDGNSLYVLFSSNDLTENYNVYLVGSYANVWKQPMQLTFCEDANCSNPMVLDKGLTNGKLAYAYRKFKGEEYTSLDSNLMYSLFDVNYFYWGNN